MNDTIENPGIEEGDICNRCNLAGKGCPGVIELEPVKDCSCHICPPCAQCLALRMFCPICYWEEKNDEKHNKILKK